LNIRQPFLIAIYYRYIVQKSGNDNLENSLLL
jgi:hypothetical protein